MTAPTETAAPDAEPYAGLTGRLARLAAALTARPKRWRELAEMRSLNDAYLRDIGISRFGIGWSVPHGDASGLEATAERAG